MTFDVLRLVKVSVLSKCYCGIYLWIMLPKRFTYEYEKHKNMTFPELEMSHPQYQAIYIAIYKTFMEHLSSIKLSA